MTLAAARARGFRRPDASELSWRVALPVLVGATALKGSRVAARLRRGPASESTRPAPPLRPSHGPAPSGAVGAAASAGPAAPGPDDSAGVAPLVAGAAAAFVSTLAAVRVVGLRRERPLWPWAVERAALAAAVLRLA